MTQRSAYGYRAALDTDIFDTEQPMSSAQSDLLRNNIQHQVDVSGQFRVNWAGTDLEHGGGISLQGNGDTRRACFTFPWTCIVPTLPMNLEIWIVAICAGSTELDITARVVPALTTKFSRTSVMWERSTTYTGNTNDTAIYDWAGLDGEEDFQSNATIPFVDGQHMLGFRPHTVDQDGVQVNAFAVWARLEVVATISTGSGACAITGVLVREFS